MVKTIEYPNMAAAIEAANLRAQADGKKWGVWSTDIDWDGPDPNEPCFVCDHPVYTYCGMVYVAIPLAVAVPLPETQTRGYS